MAERNKLLAVLIVGLLVGFGVGRIIPNVSDSGSDLEGGEVEITGNLEGLEVETESISGGNAETGAQLAASIAGALTGTDIDRPQVSHDGVSVTVSDQLASDSVLVSSVALVSPSWVAVHADRNGVPGNVLGAKLVSASAADVRIPLLRQTESGATYYVVIQEDNGNAAYDLYGDAEVVTPIGSLVVDSFIAN